MRRFTPVILAVCFLAAAGWLLVTIAYSTARGGAELPAGSADRFDPYGCAALYATLRRLHHPVTLLDRPDLPASAKGVLLVVVPPAGGRAVEENYSVAPGYNPSLLHWIRRGNTLLEFSQYQTGIMRHFKILHGNRSPYMIRRELAKLRRAISRRNGKHKSTALKHAGRAAGRLNESDYPWLVFILHAKNPKLLRPWLVDCPWNRGSAAYGTDAGDTRQSRVAAAGTLKMLAPPSFSLPKIKSGKQVWTVLATYQHKPVAIARRFGRGWIIFVGSQWPVYNSGISQAGNLDFILRQIGQNPVIMDQWELGLGHSASVIEVLGAKGFMPVLFQLLVIFLYYVWSRAGYPADRARPAAVRTDTVSDQIMSLGHLYQRTINATECRGRISTEMVNRICGALNCSREDLPRRIVQLPPNLADRTNHLLALADSQATAEGPAKGRSGRTASSAWRPFARILAESTALSKELKRVRYTRS